jgi:hypothetical protein
MKHKINGWHMSTKEWEVRHKKSIVGDRFGDSDHPDEDKPEIRILSTLKEKDMLDTEIHELVHANCPWMEEDTVGALATNIADFLWRRRYRRKTEVKPKTIESHVSHMIMGRGEFPKEESDG